MAKNETNSADGSTASAKSAGKRNGSDRTNPPTGGGSGTIGSGGGGGEGRPSYKSHRSAPSSAETQKRNQERGASTAGSSLPKGFSTPTMLGIQHQSEETRNVYQKVATLNGYTFEVPPVNRFHSKSAEQKFVQLTGSLHPKFEANRFDNLRERLQVAEKRDKDGYLQAIAMLYAEFLGNNFLKAKDIDYAELERCFYPNYAPTYDAAMHAVGLKKPLWWRQGIFASLEDISRLPLERCNREKETQLSFEEWYSLFWNYYQPFNVLAYLATVTAQSLLYTKELVDATADYLAERHATITDERAKKAPILFLGARTGKFGALLNATQKLPVPVIHTHENPNTNPYLLVIPQHKQAEFKPNPILKLKNQAALEKYEPAIVLISDMMNNADPTAQIRQQGSVREYYYFGIPNSYIEGHPWETFGYFKYRERGTQPLPPFMADNFVKFDLPFLSRWVLHKLDSDMQMGNGAVTGWTKRPLMPSAGIRWNWRLRRLKPFF